MNTSQTVYSRTPSKCDQPEDTFNHYLHHLDLGPSILSGHHWSGA